MKMLGQLCLLALVAISVTFLAILKGVAYCAKLD